MQLFLKKGIDKSKICVYNVVVDIMSHKNKAELFRSHPAANGAQRSILIEST